MGKLDLSKFKKVRSSEKHTVLRHPEGHEITIFHKALSKPVKDQLDKLEMADGGKVAGNPKLQQAYKKPDKEQALESKQHQEQMSQHFAQGGQVNGMDAGLKENYRTKSFTEARNRNNKNINHQLQHFAEGSKQPVQPAPTPSPALPNAQSTQDSMRKAFHFADGGSVDQSHAHLSEAVKHLAQKYAYGSTDNSGSPAPVESPQFNMTAPENISTPTQDAPQVSLDPSQSPAEQSTPQSPLSPPPSGTLLQQAQKNTEQANQAEMQTAQNAKTAQNQEAGIYQQQSKQMTDLNARSEAAMQDMHDKFNHVADQVEQGHIDPNHWWNSKNTGSQVLTAIGMLFSGAMSGAAGHPEMASNAIDKAIDRDIEAQKSDLNNKHTLMSKYMEMYNSIPAAEAATRLTLNAAVEGQIKQQAAKLGGANAIPLAQMAVTDRRMKQVNNAQTLTQAQMQMDMLKGINTPSSNPAEQIRKLGITGQMNPQMQEKAMGELDRVQHLQNQKDAILQAFDQVNKENTLVGRLGRGGREPASMAGFRNLVMPFLKDSAGRVNESELARTDELMSRVMEGKGSVAERKNALIKFLNEKASSSMLKGYGINPGESPQSGTQPQIAINKKTGERLIQQNGKWVPYNGQ